MGDGDARVRRRWAAVVLPMLLVALILLADVLEGPKTAFVGVLVVAPMLSAVFGRRRDVIAVGAVALVAAGLFGLQASDGQNGAQVTRLAVMALFTAVAAVVAHTRVRAEVRLAQANRVVTAVTEAIIRPVPDELSGVRLAARYIGADAEAHVGGDFYEVLETDHGLRVVLGDVRGKGLSAVRMANYVLGAFRDAARRESRLEDVVDAMDGMVSTEGEPEDFVTAVVLEVGGGTVRGITCGHPQPLLVDAGHVRDAVLPVDVPLGLGAGRVPAARMPGTPSGMLLHSDGLTEARRPGGPFLDLPVVLERLGGLRGDRLLDAVVDAVRSHVGGRLRDDVAVLWVDVSGVVPSRPAHGASTVTLPDAGSGIAADPAVRRAPGPRQPASR